jgi:enolase-phosphatase E1
MTQALPHLYLLDVEGTVAPISLVYEQLFPYAREHFVEFLAVHCAEPAVAGDLGLLAEENRADPEAPQIVDAGHPDQTIAYLNWLMDRDRKSTALKSLQGRIWKRGFESGELKGVLYADVPAALDRWAESAKVAIYSSGSIDSQRLLFRYSTFGDLRGRIAAYFDTRTGAKTARESYLAIATAMNLQPHQVLFFSDVVRELDPAREAGFDTRLVLREGNTALADPQGHIAVDTFDGIPMQI